MFSSAVRSGVLSMSRGGGFTPGALFATGTIGVWFDRQDLSTMYQESAGTTACAVGSPVGFALDKSKGLVIGAEVRGSGSAALVGAATAATYNTATGAATATRVDALNQSYITIPVLANTYYVLTVTVAAGNTINVRQGGTSGTLVATLPAGATTTVRVPTGASTSLAMLVGVAAGSASFTVESVREIPGNHATQGTSASRPILRQDSTGRYYLEHDGFDDGMATAAINFSSTNKMTAFAAVTKLSDAASGAVCELTVGASATDGGFYIVAPNGPAANYGVTTRGTVAGAARTTASIYAAPSSAVLTMMGDNGAAAAADQIQMRVNGVAVPDAPVGITTAGNYANAVLYQGRRAGASLPFNGRDYGQIVVARALTAMEITRTERWLAGRLGVTL